MSGVATEGHLLGAVEKGARPGDAMTKTHTELNLVTAQYE